MSADELRPLEERRALAATLSTCLRCGWPKPYERLYAQWCSAKCRKAASRDRVRLASGRPATRQPSSDAGVPVSAPEPRAALIGKLVDGMRAALATGDVEAARIAHEAIGRLLVGLGTNAPGVIDLATEREKRGPWAHPMVLGPLQIRDTRNGRWKAAEARIAGQILAGDEPHPDDLAIVDEEQAAYDRAHPPEI